MTTPKRRIPPHLNHPHTRLAQLATLACARITRDRLQIPHPAHTGTKVIINAVRMDELCHQHGIYEARPILAAEEGRNPHTVFHQVEVARHFPTAALSRAAFCCSANIPWPTTSANMKRRPTRVARRRDLREIDS